MKHQTNTHGCTQAHKGADPFDPNAPSTSHRGRCRFDRRRAPGAMGTCTPPVIDRPDPRRRSLARGAVLSSSSSSNDVDSHNPNPNSTPANTQAAQPSPVVRASQGGQRRRRRRGVPRRKGKKGLLLRSERSTSLAHQAVAVAAAAAAAASSTGRQC